MGFSIWGGLDREDNTMNAPFNFSSLIRFVIFPFQLLQQLYIFASFFLNDSLGLCIMLNFKKDDWRPSTVKANTKALTIKS